MAKLQDRLEEKERNKETREAISEVSSRFEQTVNALNAQMEALKDEKKNKDLKHEIRDMIDDKLGSAPKGRSDEAEIAITDITKNSDLRSKAMDKLVDLVTKLVEAGKPVNTSNLKTSGLTSEEIERLAKEGLT